MLKTHISITDAERAGWEIAPTTSGMISASESAISETRHRA